MRAKTAPSTLWGRADSTPHMQIVERLSVREVTGSRHVHRDASGLCRFDRLVVADRSTGLNDSFHAGIDQHLEAVSKREECVRGGNGTFGTALRLVSDHIGCACTARRIHLVSSGVTCCTATQRVRAFDRQTAGVHAVDLTHANPDACTVVNQQD